MARTSLRHPQEQKVSSFDSIARPPLAVGLMILCFGTGAARSQDDVSPEPAIHARLAQRSLLLDAAAIGGDFVVVGDRGHILISTDRGVSWQQTEVPTRGALTGVFFHDADRGWAVGHDSAILKTSDGGRSWELVHWSPEEESPLFDIWFSDADNGFAIGAYGSFYRTSDGGETWSLEPIAEWDFHLNHIAKSVEGRLFMAAEAGMIYRSDDGGETWLELPSPYEGSFFGTLPLDGDTVLVFGLQGHLFRSEDAGETWMPVATGTTAMLTDGVRTGDGTIVICGLGGTLLVSTDGGSSFDLLPHSDRQGISAIVDAGDGQLLVVGEFGAKTIQKGNLAQ